MTKKIAAIWAQDQNGLIGKDQSLAMAFTSRVETFQGNHDWACDFNGASDF